MPNRRRHLPRAFDPVGQRRFWFDFKLDFDAGSHPESAHPRVWASFANSKVTDYAEAYLVGLADEVRPRVETLRTWMEAQPEPAPWFFSEMTLSTWEFALYQWRQALGLCKWLSRGDGAQTELTGAVEAVWQACKERPPAPRQAAAARADLRLGLGTYLATALAGDCPDIGLDLYEASGIKRASGRDGPPRGFGEWACRHLADGGTRDATFTARGEKLLLKTLPFKFAWYGFDTEAVLWLKAIYFDSGLVKSPEQAIAKVYDCLPGVERPDFVPD